MPVYLSLALSTRDIFHLLCFLFLCGGICCSLSLTLFWRMLLRLGLIYLFFLLFLGRILCFLRILLYIFEMFLICRFLWFFVLLCSGRNICRFLLLLGTQFFFFCICHYILWILCHLAICICLSFHRILSFLWILVLFYIFVFSIFHSLREFKSCITLLITGLMRYVILLNILGLMGL